MHDLTEQQGYAEYLAGMTREQHLARMLRMRGTIGHTARTGRQRKHTARILAQLRAEGFTDSSLIREVYGEVDRVIVLHGGRSVPLDEPTAQLKAS